MTRLDSRTQSCISLAFSTERGVIFDVARIHDVLAAGGCAMGYGNRVYADGEFGDREDFQYGDDFGVHGTGARDQRLEAFAQGRWGDSGAGGGGGRSAGRLARQAAHVARPQA